MRTALALACLTLAALLAVGYWRGRANVDRQARLFDYRTKRRVGEAWGANCVWRPCHWLPFVGLLWCLRGAQQTDAPGWWIATYAAACLTAVGTPLSRRGWRCGQWMTGGHQRAASKGGTVDAWNCEPCCGRHGIHQSNTHSLVYAATQLGPISLLPYLVRAVIGNTRLMVAVLLSR